MESRGARSRHRKFYELPPEENGLQANGEEAKAERNTLTEYINSSVIGNNATFLRWVDHFLSHASLKMLRPQPLWKENCLILRLHCLWSQSRVHRGFHQSRGLAKITFGCPINQLSNSGVAGVWEHSHHNIRDLPADNSVQARSERHCAKLHRRWGTRCGLVHWLRLHRSCSDSCFCPCYQR